MPAKDMRNDVCRAAVAFCNGHPDEQALRFAVQDYLIWKRAKEAKRRQRNYQRARKRLIAAMGSKCALCPRTTRLEFDHPDGREWRPEKTSRWVRIARYAREFLEGKVRLLCRSCNASSRNHPKGKKDEGGKRSARTDRSRKAPAP